MVPSRTSDRAPGGADAVPEISVIIPFFNRKLFLRSAVLSLLGDLNRFRGFEIIGVDDGSTDGGAASLNDLPVRILRREMRGGVSAARNLGLREARGELIYFLDSDDCAVAGGLCALRDYLVNVPAAVAVGGRFGTVIDRAGEPITGSSVDRYVKAERPAELRFDWLVEGNALSGGVCLFLFRAGFVRRVGFFDETLRAAEDRDFLFRALKLSSIPLVDVPLLSRRVHDSNLAVVVSEDGLRLRHSVRALSELVRLGHQGSIHSK